MRNEERKNNNPSEKLKPITVIFRKKEENPPMDANKAKQTRMEKIPVIFLKWIYFISQFCIMRNISSKKKEKKKKGKIK